MTRVNVERISMARVSLSSEDIEGVVEVLRSGALRQGRLCDQFEREFAERVGARYAVAVSSGTAALHLAWMSELRPGDQVLVPAFTFVATASTVELAGGEAIFCDVDLATGLLDVADARKRLTPRTRGISPVHLFGNACDDELIFEFARAHNLTVVWDAAQAHGARIHGREVGGLNDLVCYSFYPTKNMTTGEGGMITTNDLEQAQRLRLLRSHGQARKYVHTMLGLNYRMTDIQAAIGLGQLRHLDEWLSRRRANAAQLDELLADVPGVEPLRAGRGVYHSYHQYTVRVDEMVAGVSRDQLQRRLESRGIETAVHYPRALHQQPVFEGRSGGPLPNSERLAAQVLSLPVHPLLEQSDVVRVGSALAEIVGATLRR